VIILANHQLRFQFFSVTRDTSIWCHINAVHDPGLPDQARFSTPFDKYDNTRGSLSTQNRRPLQGALILFAAPTVGLGPSVSVDHMPLFKRLAWGGKVSTFLGYCSCPFQETCLYLKTTSPKTVSLSPVWYQDSAATFILLFFLSAREKS